MCQARLCADNSPHIHVGDNLIAHLATRRFTHVKLSGISNIDWSVPAMRYRGRWYRVQLKFLENIWPLIKDQLAAHSVARPDVEDDEDHKEDDDAD